MVRIVVTGALGHVGSKLVRSWLAFGEVSQLTIVDDLRSAKHNSLFGLGGVRKLRFAEGDIRELNLEELFQNADFVVHLAAKTDAESSSLNPKETWDNNLTGTIKVSDACQASGSHLIFPSSTSVYGVQGETVDENCPPSSLAPQSPYAEAKLAEEREVLARVDRGHLNATVFRLGTIFGTSPGMRFHTAVNRFCWQAAFEQPITVWKTAMNQERPYLSLDDCLSAFTRVVFNSVRPNGVTNLVTVNSTVRQIVSVVQEFVPSTQIDLVDSPIMNQLSYTVSFQKSLDLGFNYLGELREGIRQTLAFLGVGVN